MTRLMSPEEYQELGRRYFKLKEYKKAAESFTQGIAASPSVSLYDHRAACYERLKDFNAAVKDGREMIKLDKKDIKGYLRTASVLEKMDKPDTALGIYKYGMKNVPVEDRNFKLLQQLHDKLTRKLSPPKAIDPFTILPVELVEMIVEYMAFRNMVNCMRVSKGWRDYLAKLSRMWMHLDLTGARKSVPRAFVNKAVKRSENNLTRMTVDRFEHMDMLKNIARVCKSLEDVEFLTLPGQVSASLIEIVQLAPNLKRLVIHPNISLDTATQILQHRPTLEHFEVRSILREQYASVWKGPFPNLRTLSINHQSNGHMNPFLDSLIPQAPALQSLTLTGAHLFFNATSLANTQLTTLILRRIRWDSFSVLPPTLRHLVLDYSGTQNANTLLPCAIQSQLPNLTHLSLSSIDKLTPQFLTSLLDKHQAEAEAEAETKPNTTPTPTPTPTPLQHLSLRVLPPPNTPLTSLLLPSSRLLTPSLLTLDLSTTPTTDDDIESLLLSASRLDLGLIPTPNLHTINLSHTNITGASIKLLVDALPCLKTLLVDGCARVSGRDAVAYAEERGVRVRLRLGGEDGSGKGRKVRW